MYCGSCLHDNALARALIQQGWNVQLVPTYTPIRTDEQDVSVDHVLFGGLNVYLQQKIPLLRHLPMFVDRFLDNPRLIRRVTARAIDTDAAMLGQLALSMLKGTEGNQRKEVQRMTAWLVKEHPDLLIFTNLLIGGCLPYLREQLKVPVLVTLQGDDIFLDGLKSPYREKCLQQIKTLVPYVDGFITHSEFFREAMSEYFQIDRRKIHVTPLGIDVDDFRKFLPDRTGAAGRDSAETPASQRTPQQTSSRSVGFLARLAPEKGLHLLIEAFLELKGQAEFQDVNLQIAGWLGPPNLQFAESQWQRLREAGLESSYRYWGAVDRDQKLNFLGSIDLLCVPTVMKEPKGLYALEAMAAGVPCLLPDQGAFPELINQSEGGYLFAAGDRRELAGRLGEVLRDREKMRRTGAAGQDYIHRFRNASSMASATSELIQRFLEK